ncbi:sensor histidine kinase [Streptomyces sp. NPDC059443]|uniref:sensor histidine kinase n=1 Tax=unclassified Streptomyces TaxID=2593676 RepID=UPI00369B93C6
MRRQLLLLTAATTALVLIALLVPLALLTRSHAADQALADATQRAQSLAAAVGGALGRPDGTETVEAVLAGAIGPDLPRISVVLPDGHVLGAPAPVTDAVRLARTGRTFVYAPAGGGRVVLVPVQGVLRDGHEEGTAVIEVTVGDEQLYDGVLASWLTVAGLGAALILLGLLVADRLGARVVGATRRLAAVADRLARGDLAARAEPSGPPELRLVAVELNQLATRIGELLKAERENAADVAHRLRTPVAALRLDAEGLRDRIEAERITASVMALERSVDEVIRTARRPLREAAAARCDLAALSRERGAFWLPLAEDQERTLRLNTPAAPVIVGVEEADLSAVLDALIGNVLDHTPHGTGFRVTVGRRTDGGGLLTVEDDGPGFPAQDVTDRGHSGAGSTGLGLDIVRRTAQESGGAIELGPPGAGARVSASFGPPR